MLAEMLFGGGAMVIGIEGATNEWILLAAASSVSNTGVTGVITLVGD